VAGLDWKSYAVNVVFFISTHCHFCEESMPFYRQVTEIPGRAPQKLAISAISRDDPELLKGTLSKQHVNLDGVYRAPVIDALSSTPIVLIVDANGIVRRVFEGRLDSSREKDVLKIVASGILGTIRT
jgi:peroxiredoxin